MAADERGCRKQRPGVLPSAGRVICAAMRVHARVRVLRGCAHARSRSGWHRTSTAAAARRAAERWTRHLRCNTCAIRVRMRVLCTSAHGWHARKNRPGRWQGRPYTHTRVWRTARSIARDRATPCALLFLPLPSCFCREAPRLTPGCRDDRTADGKRGGEGERGRGKEG